MDVRWTCAKYSEIACDLDCVGIGRGGDPETFCRVISAEEAYRFCFLSDSLEVVWVLVFILFLSFGLLLNR